MTGANIKLPTLGTVPSAQNVVMATSARTADDATHAHNAAEPGGLAPSSFQSRVTGACSSGSAIASVSASGTVACQPTNVTQMLGGVSIVGGAGTSHYLAAEGLTQRRHDPPGTFRT